MKYYGTGLFSNGQKISLNSRYLSSWDGEIDASLPEDCFRLFDYDINIGILSIHVIDLLKVRPDRTWHVEEHFHASYELHIIPYGKGSITLDGSTFSVGPGQFYLTGPYVKHEQRSDPENPMAEYCLKFDIRFPAEGAVDTPGYQAELNTYRSILGTSYPRPFEDRYRLSAAFEEIFTEVEQADIAYALKVQMLITDILIGVMRTVSGAVEKETSADSPQPDERAGRLSVIQNFIASNYARKISIRDLQGILFLSARQIDRILQKERGMTFHACLLRQRYTAAKALISSSTLSLHEIALRTGLSGEGHLHKVFRKFDAHSPGFYREKKHTASGKGNRQPGGQ